MMAGSRMPGTSVAVSLPRMADGVPAGANSPSQPLSSAPTTPPSAAVGSDGSCGLRFSRSTASARSFSERMLLSVLPSESNITCT